MSEGTTKDKIVKTMYRLVAEKGYDKASIGQISDIIGIKKASVYYYFKSKEDIFLQMVKDLYEAEDIDKPMPPEAEISVEAYQNELIAVGEKFIDSYFTQKTLRKVYAEIDIQTSRIPALKEYVKASDEKLNQMLLQRMIYGVKTGVFPKDFDAALNAQVLYTILTGIDQAILYELPIAPKAVWKEVILKLFEGKASIST
ncbi:MAG: TetR/AcrR family transcriptional regulator [Ruthenibacterium sp.]